MKILGDRLLLSPLPVQEVSDGGIFMPAERVGDKRQWYRIDQLGTGTKALLDFKVGQTVITPLHFSHYEFDDGSKRKIVGCDQIHGVLVDGVSVEPPVAPDI